MSILVGQQTRFRSLGDSDISSILVYSNGIVLNLKNFLVLVGLVGAHLVAGNTQCLRGSCPRWWGVGLTYK